MLPYVACLTRSQDRDSAGTARRAGGRNNEAAAPTKQRRLVPPIPGDILIRLIVVTVVVVVVVAMKVSVTGWNVFTIKKNVKIARYTSMTAVAADAETTDAAVPRAAAHVVLVKNGEAIREHCNDEDVGDEAGPCEAVP